jgi:anti-sigma factor RsiW
MTRAPGAGCEAIFETDLHGYIDGELPAQRRAEVELYLATHPNHAARLAEFSALTMSLHRLYGGGQPVNAQIEALTADLDRALRRKRRTRRLWRLAAGMLMLAVGAGIASSLYGRFGAVEDRIFDFTRQATDAHVLFAGERPSRQNAVRPEGAGAVAWLSQRLSGAPLSTPDLRPFGYDLSVERILPSVNGPTAQLMYESHEAEQPVTLFIGKGQDAKPTAFTYVRNDGLSIFYWQEGPIAYSLSGNLDRAELLSLAEEVNAQLVASPSQRKSLVVASPSQRKSLVQGRGGGAVAPTGASPAKVPDAVGHGAAQPATTGSTGDGAAARPTAPPSNAVPAGAAGGGTPKKT